MGKSVNKKKTQATRLKSASKKGSRKRSVKRKQSTSVERQPSPSPQRNRNLRKKSTSSSKERGKKTLEALPEKRKRQYEHIKENELQKGVDQKTAKRIAAATVNKTRSMHGETKS